MRGTQLARAPQANAVEHPWTARAARTLAELSTGLGYCRRTTHLRRDAPIGEIGVPRVEQSGRRIGTQAGRPSMWPMSTCLAFRYAAFSSWSEETSGTRSTMFKP